MKNRTLFLALICLLNINLVFAQSQSLPYSTGFDSAPEQMGWQQFRTGVLSTYDWGLGGGAFSAPTCLSHDYNVGGNPDDTVVDWFVSPPINFSSPGLIALKVYTAGFSAPFPDNCEVWFGTGDPDPEIGNFVLIGNLSFMTPQYQWLDTTLNVPFVSDSGYIAFKYKTIGAAWSTYSIDNINITVDPNGAIDEINSDNSLIRIFPNPFSNSTTIFFDNELLNSAIEIRLYDISGKEIKRIMDIKDQEIILTAENLNAGIYFIKVIQGAEIIDVRKICVE